MKKIYYYDEKSIQFKQYSLRNKFILLTLLSLGIGMGMGTLLSNTLLNSFSPLTSKIVGTQEWVDSTFYDYEIRAKVYLKRFKNTPIKAEMLSNAARNAYDSTSILLPLELALAQAQIESSMGTKGRSPKTNPFNIGEYDTKTVSHFNNTTEGIQAYYYIMCGVYLNCKEVDILFKNFTNCHGKRYASNPNYEKVIKNQFKYIQRYIENRIYKDKEK